MRLPMVDCRSLIQFCQAFEHHKNMTPSNSCYSRYSYNNNQSRNNKKNSSSFCSNLNNSSSNSIICERSSFAVVDILMLIVVTGALGFLIIPYINTILPLVFEFIEELISDAPIAYAVGLIAAFSGVIVSIAVWEVLEVKSRKCGRLECKGLRKAVEFDIQLESEECVKCYSLLKRTGGFGVKRLELRKDHKELEAELKKMAPVNGRTVLIFRASCGCPVGRLEVWGPKRIRRVKK